MRLHHQPCQELTLLRGNVGSIQLACHMQVYETSEYHTHWQQPEVNRRNRDYDIPDTHIVRMRRIQ